MEKKKERKSYKRPRIVYEKKIEILAAVCDSAWVGGSGCMKDGCDKRAG